MKTLFVHNLFGALAGAESNLLATADALKERGHTMGLAHGSRTGKEEPLWQETFTRRWSFNVDHPAKVLGHALDVFQPDLVYCHNITDPAITLELLQSGVPIVRMIHDHQLFCLRGCKYPLASRKACTRALSPYCVFPCGGGLRRQHKGFLPVRLENYSARKRDLDLHKQFDRLIVASDYMKTELLTNGFDANRISVIPPVPRENPADIQPTLGHKNRIVYAGQLVRGKGVDVLVRALSRMQEPFECLIAGDGNHRPQCERLAEKLRVADRVRFLGYVPQAQLRDYYREATVAVLGSVWPEPFGAVGLEAMRCGLPVVAFDSGGIREWLHDGFNGFLVPWMDHDRFANRLDTLLRDRGLARQLGDEARSYVSRAYNFDNYVNQLENLFTRMTEGALLPQAPSCNN